MKRTKKLLSLLLTVALVLTIVPFSGISVSAYDAPLLNSDGYYEISTADHLYWFAEQVNSGNNAINGVLLNDIVVNEGDLSGYDGVSENNWKEWTPIGNDEYSYNGTFDGAGYSVSGLYFNSEVSYIGLFGALFGTVKNLGVENSFFSGRYGVGGICGIASGLIENCYNTSTVYMGLYVGGIAGMVGSVEIKNCYNAGIVNGVAYVGGICGYGGGIIQESYNNGSVSGTQFVGGICGVNEKSIIEKCYNDGIVTGSQYTGGICGVNYKKISHSFNNGTVNGAIGVGGISAMNIYNDELGRGEIIDCYNQGDVSGDAGVGGIGCSNEGTIKNCYNIGDITGTELTGGICGYSSNGNEVEVSNCYYLFNTTLYDYGIAKTAEDFASGEVAYLLNDGVTDGTQVWYQNFDNGEIVDETPRFSGGTVYAICEENRFSNTYKQSSHNYEDGFCSICGIECKHAWESGICTICETVCKHTWENGVCNVCEITCEHNWENGVCSICEITCEHTYENSVCIICGTVCEEHTWKNGACTNCKIVCEHTYENSVCSICGTICEEHAYENSVCLICGTICERCLGKGNCTNCVNFEGMTLVTESNYVSLGLTSNYIGYYSIYNANGLYGFAEQVNSGDNAINGVLMNDIVVNEGDLSGYDGESYTSWTAWTPIRGGGYGFKGIFDGAGYTISGLYYNSTLNSDVGFVGLLGDGGSVKNVGIINSYFKGSKYVGGVVGYIHGDDGAAWISNCYNTGTVIGSSGYVGGVVGYAYNRFTVDSISDCYNTGTVMGYSDCVGGVVGYSYNYSSGGSIRNCYNTGTVTATNSSEYVGGICGYNRKCGVQSCYNLGKIKGLQYVGGICGANVSNGWIKNCYNMGTVTGSLSYVGGICGENLYSIRNCYNTGTITGEYAVGGICGENEYLITDCYNTGIVTGSSYYIGSICGCDMEVTTNYYYLIGTATDGNGTVQNGLGAYSLGSTTTDAYSSYAKTATEFASGEVAYLLNNGVIDGTQVWYQNIDNGETVDTAPKFVGGTVLRLVNGDEATYSNACSHNFVNGVCSICGTGFTGVDGNYIYKNGVQLRAYQLVEFDGDFYFVGDRHEIVKNKNVYLSEERIKGHTYADGTPIAVGYYDFDENGKMVMREGVVGNNIYKNNTQLKAYQLVEVDGDFYYIGDRHEIIKGRKVYLTEERIKGLTYADGTPITAGSYDFDENGKMVILNGVIDNKVYKNNTMLKAYQLVEIDGDFYFIGDRHEIVKGRKVSLTEERINGLTYADGTPITAGSYDFDENGKMVILNGVVGNKVYKNNSMLKAYQLVEVDGDIYYIGDRHEIIKGRKAYLSEERINGLTYEDGTPIAVGYYDFDEDGKMVILNGIVGNKVYKNNVQLKECQLVEISGDFYYIDDRYEIVKNTVTYLNEAKINGLTYADGTPITPGFYLFDEDGKLIIE